MIQRVKNKLHKSGVTFGSGKKLRILSVKNALLWHLKNTPSAPLAPEMDRLCMHAVHFLTRMFGIGVPEKVETHWTTWHARATSPKHRDFVVILHDSWAGKFIII